MDDRDDPRLDLYRDLNDPAGRSRLDGDVPAFVVEGRLAVDRLLESPYTVRSLLIDDHQLTSASQLVTAIRAQGAPVFVASRALLASTVGFSLHRGVVAVANRPSPTDPGRLLADVAGTSKPEGVPRLLAVLEGLNDHENIGALFRNAAAFGVAGVLLDPTCADPLYRRSIRVSVGHILHMPFARLAPWPSGLEQLRDAGFLVAALAPRPASPTAIPAVGLAELKGQLSGSEPPTGVALLLGAEGPGLSDSAIAASDLLVSIPTTERVDSLNVATAAAIAFHALTGI
ncbi:MAG TPA: RNA methyltransferase [Acidimicrobiales bacterium]|nr:RNA methyltransferase [Acidimicrobiales bacterium]